MVKLIGDGLSTFCPSPQAVFPVTQDEAEAGWGCILFDSFMDDSVSAGTAVVPISGNVGTRSWEGNDNGNFFIDFHHFKTPATVEAVGDKCRSSQNPQLLERISVEIKLAPRPQAQERYFRDIMSDSEKQLIKREIEKQKHQRECQTESPVAGTRPHRSRGCVRIADHWRRIGAAA